LGLKVNIDFTIILPMATLIQPLVCPSGHHLPGRIMTRCECAEMPFAEVARRLREEGQSLAELSRRTGCGQTCTACIPDLEDFLARHRP
jgi:bacterioferritin-associated ferredoxin